MTMFLRFLVVCLLFHSVKLTSFHNERRQIIEHVRKYLQKSDTTPRLLTTTTTDWLENSNKIGLGYNLLSGSPVCYTGECQMAGFTRSIFKLNYTSPVAGSCTNKLIPNNVDLDCIPWTLMNIDSEMIDTIEQLHKSISNKVQVSIGIRIKDVGFSYGYSKETQYMLDTIVKKQQTSIVTKVQISSFKLSMFEPKMELSDNFKYVIENLPCCEEDDSDIEEYIKDFIFEYYGFTYVTNIVLGGIAQQHIIINREGKERLEKQGVVVTHAAGISFNLLEYGAQFITTITDAKDIANYQQFSKEVRSTKSTTLGGDVNLSNLSEWSKTVATNPVIVEFALQDIFHLLNKRYFPDDPLITNKSKLIEKTLEKYINGSIYCYNDCGGNGTRGTCEPTGYFQFGICKCKPGWIGPDCGTAEPPKILHGTLCGFDRSFMRVNCNGERPWERCPKGWAQYNWPTDLTVCYKDQTEVGDPVHGTLCGLYSYQYKPYPFSHDIGCSTTTNVRTGKCPLGYQRFQDSSPSDGYSRINAMCAVTNAKEHLSGTLCGMQIQYTIQGPSCNGYNPGLDQCPPEYALKYTAFNALGFMVCVKK